jgi:hypothetical protein
MGKSLVTLTALLFTFTIIDAGAIDQQLTMLSDKYTGSTNYTLIDGFHNFTFLWTTTDESIPRIPDRIHALPFHFRTVLDNEGSINPMMDYHPHNYYNLSFHITHRKQRIISFRLAVSCMLLLVGTLIKSYSHKYNPMHFNSSQILLKFIFPVPAYSSAPAIASCKGSCTDIKID